MCQVGVLRSEYAGYSQGAVGAKQGFTGGGNAVVVLKFAQYCLLFALLLFQFSGIVMYSPSIALLKNPMTKHPENMDVGSYDLIAIQRLLSASRKEHKLELSDPAKM